MRSAASNIARIAPRRQRGFVLVVVLIVIAMLTLGGYAFSELMFTEHKAVRLQGRAADTRHLAESGVEFVKTYLMLPEKDRKALGGHFHNPRRFQGVMLAEPLGQERPGRFSIVAESRTDEQPPKLRFGLTSESSKLNLHALLEWDKHQPGAARAALLNLPAMTDEIADAILDWIDADDTPRELGAENEYYGKLQPPYSPPNAVPQTLTELLWVRGVTRGHLLGDDANQNGCVEPDELARAERRRRGPQSATAPYGWVAYLTLHSAEANRTPEGQPKIDLNQDDLERLYDDLVRAFEPEWATFVVAYRQFGPYWGQEPSSTGNTLPPNFALPSRFRIQSVLDLVGVRVKVQPPGIPPIVLRAPFPDDRAAMREYLPRLLERVTVAQGRIVGRVHINEAPREVLSGIPGMSAGTVEDIIAKRGREPGVIDDAHRHPAWPLVEGVVDLQQMKQLLAYVTVGSDVYMAQSVGYFEEGPIFRAQFVLDATGHFPRVVSWRELGRLGRGFDVAVLGVQPATNLPQSTSPAY